MELLRPRFCISLLAILLSLSISSTTNSDPTSAETHEWKGGEGVKRLRVRRQNLNLPDTLGLPEKTYAFYFLWRLLSEAYDATNRTSAMPATNETTVLKTFHTTQSPPTSPKTTQSEESQLIQQSENQTIPETRQVTEQNVVDSSAFKMKYPTKTAEEPLTSNQEQINHFDDTADRNDTNTVMGFFTTISSSPESQNMTDLGDSRLDKRLTNPKGDKYEPEGSPSTTFNKQLDSSENFNVKNDSSTGVEFFSGNSSTPDSQNSTGLWNTLPAEGSWIPEQKTSKPSQDTEQYIPQVTMEHVLDSITPEMKSPTKTAEEPLTTNHEQINPFGDTAGTIDSSTAVEFIFTNSSTELQNMTELGYAQLDEQSIKPEREKYESEEPPSTTFHEQLNSFHNFTVTNYSANVKFSLGNTSTPDSQNPTELGVTLPDEESTISDQKTKKPSHEQYIHQDTEKYILQDTEQNVINSTTSEMKSLTKTAEEPSTNNHEQINHFDNTADTNDSSTVVGFLDTISSSPELQNMTELEDTQLDEQSTNPERETFKPEEPPSTTVNKQINSFDKFTNTNDSIGVEFFSYNSSTPDTQNTTELWNTLPAEESTIPEQKTPEPSQVTEQHVHDFTTSEMKSPTKTAEESLATDREQINHFYDITASNDSSTAVEFLFTNSSSPESQNMTDLGDTQPDGQSTNPERETYEPEEPPSTTVYKLIDSFENFTDTDDSTSVTLISDNSSTPDSQNATELGDSLPVEGSWIPEQKTPEPSQDVEPYIAQVTEPHVLDSITSEMKSPTKTTYEPLATNHEQINPFDNIAGTNDSTAVEFFSDNSSTTDTQNTIELWNTLPAEGSWIPEQKTPEPSQVTEQHVRNFTISKMKSPTKTAEESLATNREQINHFYDITASNDSSTAVEFVFTNSSTPESQNKTDLGVIQPDVQSTNPERETYEPEEPPSTTVNKQIDSFEDLTVSNNFTGVEFFSGYSLTPDSQNTTELGDSLPAEGATIPEQKTPKPSQVTEQYFPQVTEQRDSSISEMKSPTKTTEESLATNREQINHFYNIAASNDSSTAVEFLFTNSSSPESQNMTGLGDTQPDEQSINPERETYEPPSTTVNKQIDSFGDYTVSNDSTGVEFFSGNSSTPDSQNTTELGDTSPDEESTIYEQKTTKPSQDTVQYIPQDTQQYIPEDTEPHVLDFTSEMKSPTKTVEEPLTPNHEQINHFADTNDSVVGVFSTISSTLESQNMTELGDTQLDEQSTNPEREKYEPEEPPSTTFNEKIDSFDNFTNTNHSIGVEFFSNKSSTPQNTTELGNTLPAEESTISGQKTPEPSQEKYIPQVTERYIFDSTTSKMKSPTKTAKEPLTNNQEQINHLDDTADTNDTNTVVGFFATISSSPELQNMTALGDTQQGEQSSNPKWDKYEPVDTLTQPSSKENLTSTIPQNPKSSNKHISTLVSQESSSTKAPHLNPPETVQLQADSNEKPTADTAAKESYTNNNLMDKKTQSTTSRTTPTSTARLKTQTPSRMFTFKSAVSADDDTDTSRGFFGLLFTLASLVLLITALLILVAWRRWKVRHWMNNMWVADPLFLEGTYHSLLQTSNPQTAIEMKRGKTQKKRPESSEIVPESVALQSEHADEDFSEHHARHSVIRDSFFFTKQILN